MQRVLTKAQFARALGISAPRLSVLISLGLPVRSDYRVDVEAACRWILCNVLPWGPDRPSPAYHSAADILHDLEQGEADEADAPDAA
jgi:hypothetical protein